MYTIKDLYDLDHTLAKDYLEQFTYVRRIWNTVRRFQVFQRKRNWFFTVRSDESQERSMIPLNIWRAGTVTVFPKDMLGTSGTE